MKTYLEFHDARSSKFWEVAVKGTSFVVRYGKIGTEGQSKTKDFSTKAEAAEAAEKLANSKRKKGYEETATKKTATKKTATKKTATKKSATKKSATKKSATKKTATKKTKKTKESPKRFMTEKAEKAIRKLGCWDSVALTDLSPLGHVAWNRFGKKDPASTIAIFLHILSVPLPPKGDAQAIYLTTAENACRFALKVDDTLQLQVANQVAPLASHRPSIFHEVASTYARLGALEDALAQVELAANHGFDGVDLMLADPELQSLNRFPEFVALRKQESVAPELIKRFAPHAPPQELVKLHPFDRRHSEEYSRGFALSLSGKAYLWSKKREFKKRIVIFATTGAGTDYALWVQPGESLSQAPVVVFGGEGGTHVIAEDLKALLRLLTVDCEVSVDWDEAHFYRGEDWDRSELHSDYKKWLKSNFGLTPVSKPDTLTKKAQKKWGKRYADWVTPLL
jgi:predicted DNA-binding WGR domain protein